jgi:hypothetical protein
MKTEGFFSRRMRKYRGNEVFPRKDFYVDDEVSQYRKGKLQRKMERYSKQKITTVYFTEGRISDISKHKK